MTVSSVVLVMQAKRYSFEDENKKKVKGCKVMYCENLDSVEKDNSKGVEVHTANVEYEVYDTLATLPGYYECHFDMIPTAKGSKLVPKAFNFV